MTKRTIPSDDVYTYYKQALDMLSQRPPTLRGGQTTPTSTDTR